MSDRRETTNKPTLKTIALGFLTVLITCLSLNISPINQAHAHAVLLEKQPSDGAILDEAPERFSLIFNEPVTLIKAQLFDGAGNQVPIITKVKDGEALSFAPVNKLKPGDFLVSYRITSHDGHPVAGSFQIRITGSETRANLAALRNQLEDDSWRYPVLLARILHYTGLILAAGGMLYLAVVGVPKASRPQTVKLITYGAWAGIIGGVTLLGFLGAQLSGGGLTSLFSPDTWLTAWSTANGTSAALALIGLIMLLLPRPDSIEASKRDMGWWIAVFGALLCTLSFTGAGHVTTAEPRWFALILLGSHALAATFWAGSILPLYFTVKNAPYEESAKNLEDFSHWAMRAVAILLIAGILMAWIQVEDFAGFWTDYGMRLAVKILFVLGLLAIAMINKIYLTPNLAKGGETARKSLKRTIGMDIALIAGVIIATSMLNMDPPPRTLNMIEAHESGGHMKHGAGHSAAYDFDLENDKIKLNVAITPNPDGTSSGKLTATGASGELITPIEGKLMLSNPEKGIEQLSWDLAPASDGTLRVTDIKLPFAGNWQVRADLLMDEFTKLTFAGLKNLDPKAGHKEHTTIDMSGMVSNWNIDELPRSCPAISRDVSITVKAGRKYARQGQSFGFNKNSWRVPKCARVTVTLVNEDQVRHQWMLHGLPRYLYAMGMFHIETNGGTSRTGTFIVPNDDETYLIHCDMSQHMEKGLKGIFKVGKGSGDLPSVPTLTDARVQTDTPGETLPESLIILLAALLSLTGIWWVARHTARPIV